MTANQIIDLYWPWLLVGLGVALLLALLLRRGRGQRISLSDQDTSTRTLDRPAVSPVAAAAPQLVDSELIRLKGVGPKLAAALDAEGFGSLAALAVLDDAQQAELDARLGAFSGRVRRDRLVEQARLLSEDPAAYAAAFGKGA